MSTEAKLLLGFGAVVVAVFVGGLILTSRQITPPATPQSLVAADSLQTGPANAKVTVVEFADFECPACRAESPVLEQAMTDYQGKVNFVFRHFPLPQHTNAKRAAFAGEAAASSGKFWPMYKALYDNQDSWANLTDPTDYFVSLAKQIGLADPDFATKINDGRYASKVNSDQSAGQSVGVNSTPTLFINGVKQIGVIDYPTLKGILDQDLR